MNPKSFWVVSFTSMAIALGLGLAASKSWNGRDIGEQTIAPSMTRSGLDFSRVIPRIMPSVVGIKAYRHVAETNIPERFRRFHPQQFEPPENAGSGVIVEVERNIGYVLTNEHVVRDAYRVRVFLSDGRELQAGPPKATDPKSDLAYLEVFGHDLVPAKLGKSKALTVGDWVLAIGNPFELSHTVTTGIISAKGRTHVGMIGNRQGYENFIQTDAAINPGNSGGPLVNLNAEVVGINIAIATVTGRFQGVGFAIPIDVATRVYRDLREYQRVRRGWLGIALDTVDRQQAELLGLGQSGGVMVRQIMPNEPAALAGLEQGDIILKYENEEVLDGNGLRHVVADTAIGAEVEIVVRRNRQPQTIKVVIGEVPRNLETLYSVTERKEGDVAVRNQIGIAVQMLTPDLAKEYGHEDQEGVLVSHVEDESRALRAGIRPGTLIQSIHQGKERQYPVANIEDYERAVADINLSKPIGMRIRTPNGNTTDLVTLGVDEGE